MKNKYVAVPMLALALTAMLPTWSMAQETAAGDSAVVTADRSQVPAESVVDEIIWIVGDEPIYKSDVEALRIQSEAEGLKWKGNPDCSIPEQIAVQKLFLNQAAIDSIEVSESEIVQHVDEQISNWIQIAGSQEKLEEYRRQKVSQMRLSMHDEFKKNLLVQEMKKKLVSDVTVSPADVRAYFKHLPVDSVPLVPTEVEVQIITMQPRIPAEETNRVKDELREYTDRVTKGETTFATLARLYSEDKESARRGGELGFVGRGTLDPAFASVAFNLTDPKKISKIVESEYGYHIIQLVEKRGDRINVRHILRRPQISAEMLEQARLRLDSIGDDIREGKATFEQAALWVSDDKDTRNNNGLMAFTDQESRTLTSKFRMRDLPTEVAREVENMQVGDISKAFSMINSRGQLVCAIVKLKNRIESHRATITEDFQVMKNVVMNSRREQLIHDWVVNKIKHTYVRINDEYKNCDFEYEGWIR